MVFFLDDDISVQMGIVSLIELRVLFLMLDYSLIELATEGDTFCLCWLTACDSVEPGI